MRVKKINKPESFNFQKKDQKKSRISMTRDLYHIGKQMMEMMSKGMPKMPGMGGNLFGR